MLSTSVERAPAKTCNVSRWGARASNATIKQQKAAAAAAAAAAKVAGAAWRRRWQPGAAVEVAVAAVVHQLDLIISKPVNFIYNLGQNTDYI
jgi:hypothetical protein